LKHHKAYNFIFFIPILVFYACTHKDNLEVEVYSIKDTTIHEIEFVFIHKGKFTTGFKNEIKNIPYDYWIMKYEVTNLQYFDFIKKGLQEGLLQLKDDTIVTTYKGDPLRQYGIYTAKILDDRIYLKDGLLVLDSVYANHPVTEITWFGATAFCNFHGLQLPDKFEWEKAARGMTGWNYPWGDSLESNRANYHNSGDPFDNRTTPIGFYNGQNYNGYQTKDSPSPYGCYDMAGNAWEYTNSTIFPNAPFPEGGGGSYLYHTGAMCQSWYFSKFGYPKPVRIDRPFKSDGFRCILKIK